MKKLFIILALLFGLSAYGQRFIQTFNSADDVWRANLKSVHTNLFIAYRSTANDGGGGQFWYDPLATTATNLGTVWGNQYGGRIFRIWNGEPIDIQWFGAKPTKLVGGTLTPAGTFDNAPKINAAINWARTPTYGPNDVRATVLIPAGDWWISTPITNRYRVDVVGLGCVFSDSDVPQHTSDGVSGLVSGASRIFLATGANCPMMVWDLSDAYQRYTFASNEDSIGGFTSTITIASPGVITATGHGLAVGRRVGFSTTGTLPTGIAASTIYYVVSVPTADTFTISATSGGSAINTSGSQSGTHYLIKDPSPRYVAGNTIKGINFYGNGPNQTRKDCHILKIEYAWNVRIENCYLGRPSGYYLWAYECNTLDILDCYGNGSSDYETKGVFLFSNADGMMSHCKFGGASGPALWLAGNFAWQQQYIGNFLYNNFDGRFAVSGMSSDEVTFTTDHDFETGDPIEFTALYGGTIPTLVRYPSVTLDSHIFWAIKTASNKLKVAYTYQDALSGSALSLTGGSGTYYVWRGPAAGAYLSGGANNNVFTANRCDQNQNFGIALNKATENSITANTLNLNGFNTLTGTADVNTSAGLYLRNGSANNVIVGNTMMDWGTAYAQTYGVWIDANNGRNYLGQNSYKTSTAQVDTLVSSTGNSTEIAVVSTPTAYPVMQYSAGATVYADATGSPLTLSRSDTAGSWKFELSSNTNNFRLKNSYVGNTAWNISSSTSESSLTLGSTASPSAPRPSFIYGEQASTLSGTNTSAADFYVIAGTGTGSATGGGKIRFQTPVPGSSGTTVQSLTEKFAIMRDGGVIVHPLSTAPVNGLANGAIYADSTDNLFYGRLSSTWHTLSNPNKTGVSTISVDASATFTFSPLSSRWVQILSAPITATRTVTLSTTAAQQGTEATFIRSAASTGAFNWSIGGLINLTPGSWCTVVYDGSAWVLGTFTTSGGTLTDGDKGDITVGSSGSSFTIDNEAVTYAKMQNVSAASKLLGRGDSGAGSPQEITLGSGLTMTGTTLSSSGGAGVTDGDKGDITVSGSGTSWLVDNSAITYAKIQNLSTTSLLLGRGSATVGAPQEITLGTGFSMASTTLSYTVPDDDYGDISIAGGVWSLDNSSVSFAKMADMNTQRLIGRNTAGIGAPEEVTISQSLDWTSGASPAFGDVLYRGASSWTRLAPGTSGQFLQTRGVGNSPIWAGSVTTTGSPTTGQAAEFSAAGTITGTAVTGTGDFVKATAPVLPSTVTIGATGGTTGAANLKGTTSGTVTVSVAAAAGTHTIKLPTADGTANQVLKTDGAGQWGWTTAGSGSVATDAIFTTTGDLPVGTGSSTSARLAAGDYGATLMANGAAAALFYATPNNVVTVMEHFLSHLASATIFSEVFSGVSSTSGTGNDKDHPGVYSISTGSSATSTGYLRVGNSSGTMQVGGGLLIYEQAIRIPNLSDTNQTFLAHFGFSEAGYGASTGGNHHIKFIHDVNSGNWQTSVKNNGTATTTASSTAVPTGWQKIRIVVNATASSVSFFVNGTELSSSPMTMNIPDNTDAMTFGWGITKSVGTTARTIDTDYVYLYQKLTNPL